MARLRISCVCCISVLSVELSELVVRTEYVDDLVLVHILHEVAGGTAVLAGVELCRLFGQSLAHSCGNSGEVPTYLLPFALLCVLQSI